MERSLLPKAKISSTTHAQLLLSLHGKQQQQKRGVIGVMFDLYSVLWQYTVCLRSLDDLYNKLPYKSAETFC